MPLRQDLACIFIEVTWAKEGLLKHFPSSNASAAVTSLEKTTLRVRRHEAPLPLVDLQPQQGRPMIRFVCHVLLAAICNMNLRAPPSITFASQDTITSRRAYELVACGA